LEKTAGLECAMWRLQRRKGKEGEADAAAASSPRPTCVLMLRGYRWAALQGHVGLWQKGLR